VPKASRSFGVRAAVAAGHPATAEAGLEILREGGTAADATVAASLASCVAETVMTGLLGGGHAIYFDSTRGRTRNLDCFVAVPGLGAEPRTPELYQLDVPFGAELVHYAVGPASCAVPGLPAGLEALWRSHGRLPWPRLVEPALDLARRGVEMLPAHASCLSMLAPVMTMNEGARIYAPGGTLLETGDVLEQPGLVPALELLAVEGPQSVYSGTLAEALLALLRDRDGLVTAADLAAYEASWGEPAELPFCGTRFLTRRGLSGVPETLERLPKLRGLTETDRVLTLIDVLSGPASLGSTTNLCVLDEGGSACVLTTSLGLGSGDYLPGFDLHLNSMLGESELLRGPLQPGSRMKSMMAPSLAIDDEGVALAAGAAGGTRLRTALVGVVASVLDEGLEPQAAIERPRAHPAGGTVNAEPGVDEAALKQLEDRGWAVRRWPAPHHYFGGVSAIGRAGPGADPRRSGAARELIA
jgi:gamma-glutamyltranspeptidase/glutathione hydrolase